MLTISPKRLDKSRWIPFLAEVIMDLILTVGQKATLWCKNTKEEDLEEKQLWLEVGSSLGKNETI